jgi:hypothetical protein
VKYWEIIADKLRKAGWSWGTSRQRLEGQSSGEGLFVLAISDGDERDRATDIFQQYGFTHQLVIDQARQISRRYAINCWPTTIAVDEAGLVSEIPCIAWSA